MEITKEQTKDAILLFASKYASKDGYNYLLNKDNAPLPEIVNMIICEMFKGRFDFHNCTYDEHEAYHIILSYYRELHSIGWVEFK
jgi:hypothetical protein